MAKQKLRKYTAQERRDAMTLAEEVGPSEASRRLGIPSGSLTVWRHKARAASAKGEEWPPRPPSVDDDESEQIDGGDGDNNEEQAVSKPGRVARHYTPSQRAEALERASDKGVTAASKELGISCGCQTPSNRYTQLRIASDWRVVDNRKYGAAALRSSHVDEDEDEDEEASRMGPRPGSWITPITPLWLPPKPSSMLPNKSSRSWSRSLARDRSVWGLGRMCMSWVPIGLLGLIMAIALGGISLYNRLVTLRNRYRNGFAQIDVQLKRRYDLIPNLVDTAKGYMQHERETLEAVVAARSRAVSAESKVAADPDAAGAMKNLLGAEVALGGALGKLLAVVESYPDLKADSSMQRLMEELSSTENRVAFARQSYNDGVMQYNTGREQFPAVVLAGAMGFRAADLYELTDQAEREAPRVGF